jgi:hypothetical protein
MMAIMSLATLVITTLLATGMAVLLDWLMLWVAFHLIQPAMQRPARVRSEQGGLVRGTVHLVRAYGTHQ